MVKTINVEPAPAVAAPIEQSVARRLMHAPARISAPPPPPPGRRPRLRSLLLPRVTVWRLGARRDQGPCPLPRPVYPQPSAPAAASASRGGLPLALDEKQLKVTLVLNAVKLVPAK